MLEKLEVNTQRIEANTQTLNSYTQSIIKLENEIGQLAMAFSRREGGKLSSQPESNPRGQYMAESLNIHKNIPEHAQAMITLRSGKIIERISQTYETNPKPESTKAKEDQGIESEPIRPEPHYLPKVPFLEALKAPIPVEKKEGKIDEMLELFKQV